MTAGDRALVLVIEDDPGIRRFLRASLERNDLRVVEAASGHQAMTMIKTRPPDLVILDLGLPDMSGIEIIDFVRSWSTLPIVIVSARNADSDKVEALDRGADDYLTKPFSVAELEARLRVALRHQAQAVSPGEQAVFEAGDLRVDLDARRVTVRGGEVHLTPIEYRILTAMIEHPDRVLTHRLLCEKVWGPTRTGSVHYVRVHMVNLRRKIERDPVRPRILLTEQGVGYRLCTQAELPSLE